MIGQKVRSKTGQGQEVLCVLWDRCPFVMAALLLGCLPLSAAPYSGGSGTLPAPYLISTAADFKTIGDSPADWDKCFKLTQDIDLSGYDETSLHMIGRWVALGSLSNQPFRGEFDGNGKTISGFTYKDVREDYVGLFQHVTGDIKNLKLVHATVAGDKLGTGALVGFLDKSGGLLNCSVTDVRVSGNNAVGGLAGVVDGSAHKCCSDGVVSGVKYVGGLVGQIGLGTLAYCYSKAQVIGSESVGGLAGAMSREEGIVNSSYALGEVKGDAYVAGLVGQVGAGRVYQCYAAGAVSGLQYPGGLVGYQRAMAQVLASLWDTQSSKQAKSVGGTGKTTAEMKTMDTFLAMNWNFITTWTICEGINYPVLVWQIPPGDLVCPDGVNFHDFVWFAARWRQKACGEANLYCDGADVDKSGVVEYRDLAIFAENWLAGIE